MNNKNSREEGGSSNPEAEKYGTEVMGAPAVPDSHPNNQKAATWSAGDHPPEYHQQPYVQCSPVTKPATNPMESVVQKFNSWSAKAEKTANDIWHNFVCILFMKHWLTISTWKNVIFQDRKSGSRTMGCSSSMYKIGRKKKKKNIPQVTIFVPPLRVPVQCDDLLKTLRGLIPKDLVNRISSLRNQIVFVAQDTGGSAVPELQGALEEYLSLIVGLTKRENGLQELVEFKWKNIDGKHEVCVTNSWFELLSVVHMMAILTMSEANSKLIVKDSTSDRVVTSDSMSNAVELLLKAAGYLELCMRDVLMHLPEDIKSRMPTDLQEDVLSALSFQALAQGTEMQLGLAVESKKATLPVKRRLACEQLSYLGQAHYSLSTSNNINGNGKKHLLFIKWKYLEAKAAAYYYNGLMVDKGTDQSCHTTAVCCFFAAEELLAESKKACLNFCLAIPLTRTPPLWGAMKHLNKKIPETAIKKSQMYGYLLDQEKGLQTVPDLPEFELSLKPEEYELPEKNAAWDRKKWEMPGQTLKEHLIDSEEEMETK